ncbi:MAG: hypothetical protein AVDCRST_MAG78-3694, partial [uncultured Rubrobacteraceae bacterium]
GQGRTPRAGGGAQERRVGHHRVRRRERVLGKGVPVLDTGQRRVERSFDRALEPRRLPVLGPVRWDL